MTPFEMWCSEHGYDPKKWFEVTKDFKPRLFADPIEKDDRVYLHRDDGTNKPYFFIRKSKVKPFRCAIEDLVQKVKPAVTPFEKWCEARCVYPDEWLCVNHLAKERCVSVGTIVGIADDDGSEEPYFFVQGHGHMYLRLDMLES